MQKTASAVDPLLKVGKQRGYLTYEELNDSLPDDTNSPDQIDRILLRLDKLGIDLVDEAEVESRTPAKAATKPAPRASAIEVSTARIDDPVRMYLTQMGEIPLLTRDEEISLSKKIS